MKIIRMLTYEGTAEQLRSQLKRSLPDGVFQPGVVRISVETRSLITDEGEHMEPIVAEGSPWFSAADEQGVREER